MNESRIVQLDHEPVELYRILKFEGLVDSGGMAKQVISEGAVRLNGEVETRKRKKVIAGDRVEFANVVMIMEVSGR